MAALFDLGLPSTLIRHENGALFFRLGLPSTLIRDENGALFFWLGLPSTLIRHENGAFWRKRSSNHDFSLYCGRKTSRKMVILENDDIEIIT